MMTNAITKLLFILISMPQCVAQSESLTKYPPATALSNGVKQILLHAHSGFPTAQSECIGGTLYAFQRSTYRALADDICPNPEDQFGNGAISPDPEIPPVSRIAHYGMLDGIIAGKGKGVLRTGLSVVELRPRARPRLGHKSKRPVKTRNTLFELMIPLVKRSVWLAPLPLSIHLKR